MYRKEKEVETSLPIVTLVDPDTFVSPTKVREENKRESECYRETTKSYN